MTRAVAIGVALLLAGAVVVSIAVQVEADPVHEEMGGDGPARALILYHPSRDARFSDELSAALAEGLIEAGMAVERATLTGEAPGRPTGYDLVAVVSNTYWWTPDRPTLRYLERARLRGIAAVGVVGGAGATARSERLLREALRRSGADVIGVRSFWLWRPNDEERMDEPNREVARELARRFAHTAAEEALDRPEGRSTGSDPEARAETLRDDDGALRRGEGRE